ncbi:MAG TPA: FkbM family methyltransferase [Longimicrobium sp.]|nr:FkbM family methyltransferase [Longimicrobium sp.]
MDPSNGTPRPRRPASANASAHLPLRLRVARALLRGWPLPRGRDRVERLLLGGFRRWPERADVPFAFGTLVDASLSAWPLGYRELFLHGQMEPSQVAVWRAVLRPGDVVVDGGANWGYWTLVAAALVRPGGRVFAFEPLPDTAAALRRNLEASGAPEVTLVQAGLDARPGTLALHVFADDPSGGFTSAGVPGALRPLRSVSVPAESLDDFAAREGVHPVLVKLDVEGGERAALLGARGLLAGERAPVVSFEWNEETAASMGYHPRDVLALLTAEGYRAYLPDARGALHPFDPAAEAATPMVWCVPPSGPGRERLARLLPAAEGGR